MTYQPFPVERFGSLNLLDDPGEVGAEGATDLLNVDLDRLGRVRTRAGLAQYDTSGSGGSGSARLFADYATASTPKLMVAYNQGGQVVLDRISGTGTVIANIGSWGAANPPFTAYAFLGTPTVTYLYLAASGITLEKYDGAALSTSSGKPSYVAVTPWDNRLAQAYYAAAADSPSGANGSNSTVFFSDAGAPESYGANNFIHLRPGDGEEITGIATFADNMIVAKQSNLFVFYGVAVGGTGDPIFNYRRIAIPARISNATKAVRGFNSLIVGDDGVYFLTNRGLFVTNGSVPQLVSGAVTPVFDGSAGSSVAWDGTSTMKLDVAKQRVFITYTNVDGNQRTLVFDARRQFWTVWKFPSTVSSVTAYGTTDKAVESTFAYLNSGHVYKFTEGQTSDFGTAIESYWKSGLYRLSDPGMTTFTRWTRVWGSGAPTVSVFTDYASSDSRAAAVMLGTDPAVAEGYHQQSYKAEWFQHKLGATSGAWTASRVQHDVAASR